jgi:hypothetical protein
MKVRSICANAADKTEACTIGTRGMGYYVPIAPLNRSDRAVVIIF